MLAVSVVGTFVVAYTASAAARYVFPVIGKSSFINDFNACRGTDCQRHGAIDIMAGKHQKIVSVSDGVIEFVAYPQPYWGYAIITKSSDGHCYWYLHLNNDARGTDNGRGGAMMAYAPDMLPGNPIKKGQLMGYVGDSGNAENTAPHLHFSAHKLPDSSRSCDTPREHTYPPLNPYNNLKAANRISTQRSYPALPSEILPFGGGFKGRINVAKADMNNDGKMELIVGAGHGGGPKVNIYNGSKQRLLSFYAFARTPYYGADVAAGDIDNDGSKELVTATRVGTGGKVAIFRYNASPTPSVSKMREFTAYSDKHYYGPRIAVGEVDGSNAGEEIIVGAGLGHAPQVKIFSGEGELLRAFTPYGQSFLGGVDVAVADVAGSTANEIIVSPLTKGSSRVQVFNGQDLTKVSEFYAFGSGFIGGAWISAGNVDKRTTKAEIVAVANGGGPRVSYFNGSGQRVDTGYYMEEWWRGYYDVAAGDGDITVATGLNRRGSVRTITPTSLGSTAATNRMMIEPVEIKGDSTML